MASLFYSVASAFSQAISSVHYPKTCQCVPCTALRVDLNRDRDESRTINCTCGFKWTSINSEFGRKMSYFADVYHRRSITIGNVVYGFLHYMNNIGIFRYKTGYLSPEIIYAMRKISTLHSNALTLSEMAANGDIEGIRNICSMLLTSPTIVPLDEVYDIIRNACLPGSKYINSGTNTVDVSCLTYQIISLYSTYIYLACGCGHAYHPRYSLISNFNYDINTYEYVESYHKTVHNELECKKMSRRTGSPADSYSMTGFTSIPKGDIFSMAPTASKSASPEGSSIRCGSYTQRVQEPVMSYTERYSMPIPTTTVPISGIVSSPASSDGSSNGSQPRINRLIELEKLRTSKVELRTHAQDVDNILKSVKVNSCPLSPLNMPSTADNDLDVSTLMFDAPPPHIPE